MQGIVASWERFWLDRDVEPGRLAALRVVLFGLLGVDQLHLMVRHAWRYGVAGFNLAHFRFLDALPTPRADLQAALYLICGFLALRVAAGIAVRGSLYALTALYSYAYFMSQLDGYQHHYLLCWILLISCAIPFHLAPGVDRPGPPEGRIPAWGLSLLYAQVSIVYLFTGTSKVSSYWLNGWALEQQISNGWIREMMRSAELALGASAGDSYAAVATGVCVWQFVVAASFVAPGLRAFACVTGPLFHGMVEVIGLEIEWFSYYMIALYYLLLFPDPWYIAVARRLGGLGRALGPLWGRVTAPVDPPRPIAVGVTALLALACGALGLAGALPGAGVVAAGLTAAVALSWRPGPQALGRLPLQVALAALVFAVPRYTGSAYDFYRFQGGDYLSRGELEAAVESYSRAVALGPDRGSRRVKLAGLLQKLGREEEAVEIYREAARLDPGDGRAREALERLGRAAE